MKEGTWLEWNSRDDQAHLRVWGCISHLGDCGAFCGIPVVLVQNPQSRDDCRSDLEVESPLQSTSGQDCLSHSTTGLYPRGTRQWTECKTWQRENGLVVDRNQHHTTCVLWLERQLEAFQSVRFRESGVQRKHLRCWAKEVVQDRKGWETKRECSHCNDHRNTVTILENHTKALYIYHEATMAVIWWRIRQKRNNSLCWVETKFLIAEKKQCSSASLEGFPRACRLSVASAVESHLAVISVPKWQDIGFFEPDFYRY